MPMLLAISVLVAIALYVIWVFNRLISLKVRASNAWSDIDVQLKRRADLIPGLVQTVRGYAAHERTTLEAAISARSRADAADAHTPGQRARIEAQVGRDVAHLIALAEAYPDLKADQMFASLHNNLVEVENHIQSARRYYNAVVRDLNTAVRVFPQSLIATLLRFKPREFFELDAAAHAGTPSVQFSEDGS